MAGKIVFAAPSRPLVLQQIEACHNIVGIPQVRLFFILLWGYFPSSLWIRTFIKSALPTYLDCIGIKLVAGMDNWFDRSNESYEKSLLLESQTSFLCYSTSTWEGYSIWWISECTSHIFFQKQPNGLWHGWYFIEALQFFLTILLIWRCEAKEICWKYYFSGNGYGYIR